MKKLFTLIIVGFFASSSLGELFVRDLDGDFSNGHEAVYDDVLNITWLADTNLALTESFGVTRIIGVSPGMLPNETHAGAMWYSDALEWMEGMNAFDGGAGYHGYNNWRLPTMVDINNDGCVGPFIETDCGYSLKTYDESSGVVYSELAYMYFDNFEGLPARDIDGSELDESIYGIDNAVDPNEYRSLFSNLGYFGYWTDQRYILSPELNAWMFVMWWGSQGYGTVLSSSVHAWPVHDGDIGAAMDCDITVLALVIQEFVDDYGVEKSLGAKLGAALRKLEDANTTNDVAFTSQINALINQIEAQRGKKLTDDDASYLLGKIEQIVGCTQL